MHASMIAPAASMLSLPASMFSRLRPVSLPLCTLALLALLACSRSAPPASADAAQDLTIAISDAWVRQPPPEATVAAAYLNLSNPGPHDDRLLAVESPAAGRVEIHDMQVVSGMMQMREITSGLPLPAGETVTLAPGSMHLMLIAPKMEFKPGDEVMMQLRFEHTPAQAVVFQVRSLMDGDGQHMPEHDIRHGHHGHPH